MVVVMQELATDEQVQRVIAQLVEMGFDVHRSTGALRTVIGAVGGNRAFDPRLVEVLDGVQEVLRITEPYKLASRTFRPREHRRRRSATFESAATRSSSWPAPARRRPKSRSRRARRR